MVGKKRAGARKKFLYFFLNNKIHKVIKLSRAKDELVAWCYPDKKRVLYAYSEVKKYKESAYTTKEVAELLNKHKVTIEEYILTGKIKIPQRIYPIGNPSSEWSKFMFSESDILDLHQYILDVGYTKICIHAQSLQPFSNRTLYCILRPILALYQCGGRIVETR